MSDAMVGNSFILIQFIYKCIIYFRKMYVNDIFWFVLLLFIFSNFHIFKRTFYIFYTLCTHMGIYFRCLTSFMS